MEKTEKYDITLVGVGVNPEAAGKNNKYYDFLDSIGAKFLYNAYYDSYTTEPMALLHLAAQIKRNGYKVNVVDGIIQSLGSKVLTEQLIKSDCDVYAFTMFDTSEEDVCEIIREIKKHKPNAVCITGGPYPTIEYQKLLNAHPEIDFITIGDGENVYTNYINVIKNNEPLSNVKNIAFKNSDGEIVITEREVVDLDTLAYTDRMFAQKVIDKGFSLGVNTSRGCAHGNCSFCYLKDYQTVSCQPKIRYRSPEVIVDELKKLIEEFHIDKVTFCDDDFFGTNKEGIERACNLFKAIIDNDIKLDIYVIGRIRTIQFMIKSNLLPLMKAAGVSCAYLGFDSYNDDILERYQKGFKVEDINEVADALHKNGIRINPGLITFEPILTIDHVKQNVELFKKLGYYDAYMFTRVLVILPGMRKKYFNDEELDIYDEDYYRDPRTKVMYEELSKYLDVALPYYRMVDRSKITEAERQLLYAEHYGYFDFVYSQLKEKGTVETEEYLARSKQKIEIIVGLICREIGYGDEKNGEKVLQKQSIWKDRF